MTDEKKQPGSSQPDAKKSGSTTGERRVPDTSPPPAQDLGRENPGYVAFLRVFGRS